VRKWHYAASVDQVHSSGMGEHQVWNVHDDISMKLDPRLDLLYKIHGVKVGSPAFVYDKASIFEVRKFCEKVLRENMRHLSSEFRTSWIISPCSCRHERWRWQIFPSK
jgi:hypothetical protein